MRVFVWEARKFLSTLSLRRATTVPSGGHISKTHFYPRSPCGERHAGKTRRGKTMFNFYPRSPCGERLVIASPTPWAKFISIHALLAESDPASMRGGPGLIYFYPRSPCGERPVSVRKHTGTGPISIHALLAESDSRCGWLFVPRL